MSRPDRPNWPPTDSSAPQCRTCGARVTRQFARVFGADGTDAVFHCPDCEGICGRDLKQGAATRPDYDPERDRGRTSENMPVFNGGEPDE
ncbi:DUF7563 family protein [Natrinema thermotolerans]|uniref:DUF7563 family protein n=1 Tax=Natrinema thermotolerans TaxID=121872 RepID=UPI000678F3ED|nr:hypothetical protein [Natrinema thermotolerans]QCC57271.1 hypothetical protein DVR14_00935 [Natrinema thermotolerans]